MLLRTHLKDVLDALSDLVAQHVRLARLELAQDARFFGKRVGLVAICGMALLIGYGCLCTAGAFALARLMPVDVAFLVIGLVHVLVGGVAMVAIGKQFDTHHAMSESIEELQTSSALLRKSTEESLR